MRRYAVRFLVALLTFGLGVTLSLVLGLFKPQEIITKQVWNRRPPCPKKVRAHRAFITTESSEPLKLFLLGYTPDGRLLFQVLNLRDQTISGYSIKGNQMAGTDGTAGPPVFEWISEDSLLPGEARNIETTARDVDPISLRVATVTYQSGFTWINPRDTR